MNTWGVAGELERRSQVALRGKTKNLTSNGLDSALLFVFSSPEHAQESSILFGAFANITIHPLSPPFAASQGWYSCQCHGDRDDAEGKGCRKEEVDLTAGSRQASSGHPGKRAADARHSLAGQRSKRREQRVVGS